ncbi:MAG TPA: hypothetical protein VNJ53_00910 [Gaiellaceae bacterium]|nr:hypothetical protein [Gaiellaceae bacterium]
MSGIRLGRIFWLGAATILVAAAAVALAAIVRGDFSDTDVRILGTLAALLYTGGTGLAGLALVDRGVARPLGWLVAAAAPVCLAVVVWAIWNFVFDGSSETEARVAWSSVLLLLAGLVAVTALLFARRPALRRLAGAAGALAGLAATLSAIGVWTEPESDGYVKALAVLWVLAGLAYFLVPVLQRFTSAGERASVRVLGELDGIELVAVRGPVEGVPVSGPAPGERLLLRRRG